MHTRAKQVVMFWACAAKRRRLVEEMYGAWSRGCQTM